ncbi:hypothetical protein DPMN_014643 [Dreissena polymorpha]|uniref:Uncharacterized protein n=1 Tax=Dreissena polymorpha TaxID=45954 RepID=A0A9D4N9R5_DREPO|nr:hypothetical protein DPMN_014643 [Dreissena polymorpha]
MEDDTDYDEFSVQPFMYEPEFSDSQSDFSDSDSEVKFVDAQDESCNVLAFVDVDEKLCHDQLIKFIKARKGVYSACLNTGREYVPRMQIVKGSFFLYAVLREGCFFRREFIPVFQDNSCVGNTDL